MTDESLLKRLNYEYPYYEDYVEPKGALSIDKRSHACFHYCRLAMKARGNVIGGIENQIIQYRIGDTPAEWRESRDLEIAKGVALMYGLENPGEFLHDEWRRRVWAQTQILGVYLDEAVLRLDPKGDRNKIH